MIFFFNSGHRAVEGDAFRGQYTSSLRPHALVASARPNNEFFLKKKTQDTVRGKETIRTHFRSLNDKKLCIIGLASILRTPRAQLPASIQEGVSFISFFSFFFTKKIKKSAHA
jgi:hypothetical protein